MSMHQWQVIVVEDELDNTEIVAELLGYHNARVTVAQNGAECIKLLKTITPTLVITDLDMPIKDGWQTLKEIRENPKTADIPVVAITAYHSVNVAEDALNAGFDAYFGKPFNMTTFIDELKRVVGDRH